MFNADTSIQRSIIADAIRRIVPVSENGITELIDVLLPGELVAWIWVSIEHTGRYDPGDHWSAPAVYAEGTTCEIERIEIVDDNDMVHNIDFNIREIERLICTQTRRRSSGEWFGLVPPTESSVL